MTHAYDPNLVKTAQIVAQELAMADEVQTGIYTCVGGPNYETVAELRMLKQFGLDAVGMSTVSSRNFFLNCLKSYFLSESGPRGHNSTSMWHEIIRIFPYHERMQHRVRYKRQCKPRWRGDDWTKATREYCGFCDENGGRDWLSWW